MVLFNFGQSSAVSPLVGKEVDVGLDVFIVGAEVDVDTSFCVDAEGDKADVLEEEGYEVIVTDEEGADRETVVVEEAESVAGNSNGLEVDAVLRAITDDMDLAVTLEFLEELQGN